MSMELSESSLELLNELITGESVARPELSRRLSVTAPTVGSGLRELQAAGLVVQTGAQKGPMGRTAALFGLSQRAGWVLGVDFGSTQVAVAARALNGASLGTEQYSVGLASEALDGPTNDLIDAAKELVTRLIEKFSPTHGNLLSVGIALPHVVPNDMDYDTFISWDGNPIRVSSLLETIGIPSGVPVLLENNTNCAALAELAEGRAVNVKNFLYLQIGVRIGAGIVSDGRLHRGARGAGGELALLPFPFAPAESNGESITFGLEQHVGSESLMRRVRGAWSLEAIDAPRDVKELFALSDGGHRLSREFTERHVQDVARVALTVVAILDPELVVLGGGVGQSPVLVPQVRALVNALNRDIEVVPSLLGDRGTAEGAAFLAGEFARVEILGERRYVSTIAAKRSTIVMA